MSPRINQSSTAFFDDLSHSRRYSEIGHLFDAASKSEPVIGWTEGIVHETKSTQKGAKILLVQSSSPLPRPSSESKHDTVSNVDKRHDPREILRVIINCTKFSRFVFAINQHIKISLEGAREPISYKDGALTLEFSGDVAIQYLGGGVCVPDSGVIDTRQGRDYKGACSHVEFATSKLSLDNPGASPPRTPRHKCSPRRAWSPFFLSQPGTPSPNTSIDIGRDYNDIETYPPLTSLTEGMVTPLLGMVETIKTPSETRTGGFCVSLVLADVSSYRAKRGFNVTCFTSKSSLARDLPTPSPGDVILLKLVSIERWAGGISGKVSEGRLDWIVYKRDFDRVVPAGHAASDTIYGHDGEGFYTDVSARKGLFKQFLAGIWRLGEWGLEA